MIEKGNVADCHATRARISVRVNDNVFLFDKRNIEAHDNPGSTPRLSRRGVDGISIRILDGENHVGCVRAVGDGHFEANHLSLMNPLVVGDMRGFNRRVTSCRYRYVWNFYFSSHGETSF